MELLKIIKKHMIIFLICSVSPSFPLNENLKGIQNNVGNNLNQAAVNNAKKIIAARRQSAKASPIQISPQPLITRGKVINPLNSVKVQNTANNKIPVGSTVKNDETVNKDTATSKNIEKKVVPETKSEEKYYEEDDGDDLDEKPETKKVGDPKPDSLITKNNKTISKTNEIPQKLEEKIATKNITMVKMEKLETKRLGDALNNSKNTSEKEQSKSAKGSIKNKDPEENEVQDKRKSNKPENVPKSLDIKLLDKVTDKKDDLENSEAYVSKENVQIKPTKSSKRRNGSKIVQKHNMVPDDYNIPVTTRLELNVDPRIMEKLTNDASDKICIKDSNFEELRVKYNNPSSEDISNEDITVLNNNLSDIIDAEIDLNKIDNLNGNDYLKNDDNRFPKDRVWRKWKNTEIHIKSNYAKDIKPNIIEEPRDICDCYSNVEFNPVEYVPSKFEPGDYNYPTLVQSPSRYYSPYSSWSSCYKPQSYGYQYAPVSRYQNYLFPCL